MMNFKWELQRFATTTATGAVVDVAAAKSAWQAKNAGAVYLVGTSGATATWLAGTVTATEMPATTTEWASYASGTVAIAAGGKLVDNGDTYAVTAGTPTTPTAAGTAAAIAAAAKDFYIGDVNIAIGAAEPVIMSHGGLNAGTATITLVNGGNALNVYNFGTNSLTIDGVAVDLVAATGSFKQSGGVYTYVATDNGQGQKVGLGNQTDPWSLKGSSFDDTLVGAGTGATTIDAGAGADNVTIKSAKSYVYGGAGNDKVSVDGAAATGSWVYGEDGDDTIDISGTSGSIYVDAGEGNNIVRTGTAADLSVVGGSGNDVVSITGAATNAWVQAGAGNDTIYAGTATGATLNGGDGNDLFDGAGTNNVLILGTGADTVDVSNGSGTVKTANITDYSLSDGDVIKIKSATVANVNGAESAFKGSGAIAGSGDGTIGGAVTLNASDAGFYAAKFVDGQNNSQYVGWVKSDAPATIDASGMDGSVILMGTQNDDGADLLVGGAKADTIYAGTNDSVYGGAKDDRIELANATKNVLVGVGTNSGKDTVTNFGGGFDEGSNGVYLVEGGASDVTMRYDAAANIVTLKAGSGQLLLNNMATASTSRAGEVLVNGAKVAVSGSNSTIVASAADYADFYRGTDKAGALSFATVDDAVSVDLSNTDKYQGMATVVGGTGTSTLMGSASKETLVAAGGATSLWGGADNKADVLVGNAQSEDTFVFTTGAGKDSIQSFATYTDGGTNDLLNTFGSAITGINRTASNTVKVTVGGSTSDVLTLRTTTSAGADDMIQWTDGTNSGIAKVGYAAAANTFTYNADASLYLGGKGKDTLKISDSEGHNIWLDGSQGATYSSIDVLVNSGSGSNQLAGDSASQSIVAGRGGDSLWGGASTAADTLKGGSGDDVFFYGYENGKDVMQDVSDADLVNLFNITLDQVQSADISKSGSITVTAKNGDVLTVNKLSGATGATFQLADGAKWTATYSTQQWSQG